MNDGLFGKLLQQAYHAATVIRQMQRMALNSGGSGGRSPVPQRSISTGEQPCGSVNGSPNVQSQDQQK